MKRIRLLIACGGTAGHIFPAVAMADSLSRGYPESAILFAGAFNSRMQDELEKRGYEAVLVPGPAMPYHLDILIFPFLIKLFLSIGRASRILKNWHPDVVVSMGSFSGGPFVAAGKLNRCPVLVHEQNFLPGRANRISAYIADKIATSFDSTKYFFSKSAKRKIVYTGNPVRREIFDSKRDSALSSLGLENSKFTILVAGGSQGSRRINEIFIEAARGLDKDNFQVLHLAGKSDFTFLSSEYKKMGIKNKVFEFLDNMAYAYAASDLVVCRSGATTIAEITNWGLASILIPYPYADAHKKENAKVLEDNNAAIVIQEKDLDSKRLCGAIKGLSLDENRLQYMRDNSKRLAIPDAAERLAKEVMGLADVNQLS